MAIEETTVPRTSQPVASQPITRPAGTSKLALLVSFVAGAFAAWLLINALTEQREDEARSSWAPKTTLMRTV